MSKTKTGSALLLATILLFVVLSLVVSLSYVTVMEQQMSSKTKSSVGSFFKADSGVEWALNKIANESSDSSIASAFTIDTAGKVNCPEGFGCTLYLLDENGKVMDGTNEAGLAETVADIKAVRAVGTQTTGDPTQRAIEAAVAQSEGYSYTYYCTNNSGNGTPVCPASVALYTQEFCDPGFTVVRSLGHWGYIAATAYYVPAGVTPGGGPYVDFGQAYVCSK